MTPFQKRLVPGYDLFKLIVAIILILLLIMLVSQANRDASEFPSAYPSTPSFRFTKTSIPAPTETQAPTPIFAPLPGTPAPLPSRSELTQATVTACPSAITRIKIGDTVCVLLRLNFRYGPGLNWEIIKTNNSGTDLEVIGGPICTSLLTDSGLKTYLWWKGRTRDGQEGWSAEAPLINSYYFLDPVE
ncbi:MAG: SH3 domain-containing protein [Anaerolineales bacterium]